MSEQANKGGAGMVQGAPRPGWWIDVTLRFHHACFLPDDEGNPISCVMVDLIFPDGTSFTLDSHHRLDVPLSRVRDAAADMFKALWDPVKRCRR